MLMGINGLFLAGLGGFGPSRVLIPNDLAVFGRRHRSRVHHRIFLVSFDFIILTPMNEFSESNSPSQWAPH